MKRLITALILLIVTTVGCVYAYFYMQNITNDLDQSLSAVRIEVEAGDLDAARNTLNQSYNLWQRHYKIINALIHNNQISDTNRQFHRARQALNNQDHEQTLLQLVDLQDMIQQLFEKEKFSISNIL